MLVAHTTLLEIPCHGSNILPPLGKGVTLCNNIQTDIYAIIQHQSRERVMSQETAHTKLGTFHITAHKNSTFCQILVVANLFVVFFFISMTEL